MRRLLILVLAPYLAIFAPTAHALHTVEKRAAASALAQPGLLVLDSSDLRVLAENKPDSTRVPASVLKLLTATVAIQYLGTDLRYATTIWRTDVGNEFLIRGALDPFLTTSRYISDKYGHGYLPSLINKSGASELKKLKIYYEGLYPKDVYNLSVALKNRGIKSTFVKVTNSKAAEIGKEELATLDSKPFSKIISHVIMWSDNLVADRLASAATRSAGYEDDGAGLTATFKAVMSGLGVSNQGLKIRDGSGLSKKNQVTARTVVELLIAIKKDPKFASIIAGLPIAGKSGTLEKRFEKAPGAIGMVQAKTGWVNRSVTLAGYAKSGEKEYVFAILADGITPTLKARNAARRAMDKLLETIVMGDH